MKKSIFTLLLSISSIYVWAQDNEQSNQNTVTSISGAKNDEREEHSDQLETMPVQPYNYGSVVIDWGWNVLEGHPAAMKSTLWGSRCAKAGFFYNIRLGHTPFVISPGIGISFHGYQFEDNDTTLARDEENRRTTLEKASKRFPKSNKIDRSAFDMRYIDLMLEARFNANSKCPQESFFVALGGKLGWLWKASATVVYQEDDTVKKQNNIEHFNLNRMRFGGHVKLGWGRFGLCYTYIPSSLFEPNKGPDNKTIKTHSLTLAIDLF
jgi:Outer membrane protein beta-barrel domain